jgi:hypothetical protein
MFVYQAVGRRSLMSERAVGSVANFMLGQAMCEECTTIRYYCQLNRICKGLDLQSHVVLSSDGK